MGSNPIGGTYWIASVAKLAVSAEPVFDLELPLEEAAAGYQAMDSRQAIKVLLRP